VITDSWWGRKKKSTSTRPENSAAKKSAEKGERGGLSGEAGFSGYEGEFTKKKSVTSKTPVRFMSTTGLRLQ